MLNGKIQKCGICLILAGTLLFSGCNQKGETEGDTIAVQSVSMLAGLDSSLSMDKFAGKVVSQNVVEVKKDAEKKLGEVLVEAGDEVHAGDVLFTYDLDEINRNIETASLELDKMRSENQTMIQQRDNLVKEKEKAPAAEQLSYTLEIQEQEIAIKENEYKITSKEKEIENLKNSLGNAEVKAEIDGVIQKVNDGDNSNGGYDDYSYGYGYGDSGSSDAFITIMQTGSYRVKGQINEQNMGYLWEGMSVIIRSRVDQNMIWTGSISLIDTSKADDENNNGYFYYDTDAYTSSTKYAFYVELDSLDGLMIGQHVFIEPDLGQAEVREGIWLSSYYLDLTDESQAYVWAATEKDKLVKKAITLGEYDESLDEYQITEGLTEDDYIAIPEEGLEEGLPVTRYDEFYFDGGDDFGEDFFMEDGYDYNMEDGMPENGEQGGYIEGEGYYQYDENGNLILPEGENPEAGIDMDSMMPAGSVDGLDEYFDTDGAVNQE